LAIASRLGLDPAIVSAAKAAVGEERIALEDMLADIRSAEQHAKADRAIASADRARADEWASRLEAALVALDREREGLIAEARAEAAAELESARRLAAHLQAEARAAGRKPEAEALAEVVVQATAAAAQAETRAQSASTSAAPAGLLEELPPGASVRVPGLEDAGEVVEWRSDGMVEVAVGRLRMTVPARQLEQVSQPEPPAAGRSGPRRSASAAAGGQAGPGARSASTPIIEIDLRGKRVDEALEQLDRHLDRAVLAGAPWVNVIHGHGTGAMKKAVRDLLAAHPQVASFRPGAQGEGGDGVTVVQLA
jgi:DNA mismatch repair protein MutS2